jgi:hypothetical protein
MIQTDDGIQELILNARAKGLNWFDIQKQHGIDPLEARQIYNEAMKQVASQDPVEMRMLMQVRLEKVVNYLWAGLEAGNFKNGEAILKAVERMSELMDLNQETIKHQITLITDEQTLKVFETLDRMQRRLYARVDALPLSEEVKLELTAWPEWAAEAATDSVEEVLIVEEE